MQFLQWLQGLSFSIWLNESSSLWAFPMFLFVHTLGMSVVAGGAAMMAFALLGLWPTKMPIRPLERLYPILWLGFIVNALTGISIFMKDAPTYGINLDFYVKLAFVFAGLILLKIMRKQVFADPRLDNGPVWPRAKLLAAASLFCWFAAIVAGRATGS